MPTPVRRSKFLIGLLVWAQRLGFLPLVRNAYQVPAFVSARRLSIHSDNRTSSHYGTPGNGFCNWEDAA